MIQGTGFLQIGDIHIGECRNLDGYLERHKSILEQAIFYAKHYQLPLVVSGDLFHLKGTTHKERHLAAWFLNEIEKTPHGGLVIGGNHDHIEGEFTQLHEYEIMPFTKVKIIPKKPQIVQLFGIEFFCIPWGGYSTEELEKIVLGMAKQSTSALPRVVVMHECLIGSKFDNGTLAPKGCKIPNLAGISYWAIGDLHAFQKTNVPNGYYAGAPAQFKSDDVPGKGMLLVELSKPTEPKFLPIKTKEIRVVKSYAEVKDDAYYIVEGEYEDVLKANRDANVIRAEWKPAESQAMVYQKLGIYDGLPEFLANKGLSEERQGYAVDWVKKVLNLEGAVK